ncbi:MAG: hypothetical protein DMG40_06455 [Acidobacteria bacterium]|nr:MAG: hypothetical protein DMG40_06455 [Acidobacteriota bacterium]
MARGFYSVESRNLKRLAWQKSPGFICGLSWLDDRRDEALWPMICAARSMPGQVLKGFGTILEAAKP